MARKSRRAGETIEVDGTRFRQYRIRLGLSQQQVASRAGLTKSYVSLIETSNKRVVSLKSASALAAALDNISLSELESIRPNKVQSQQDVDPSFSVANLELVTKDLAQQLEKAVQTIHQLHSHIRPTLLPNRSNNFNSETADSLHNLVKPYEPLQQQNLRLLADPELAPEEEQASRLAAIETAQLLKQFVPEIDFCTVQAAIIFGAYEATQKAQAHQGLRKVRENVNQIIGSDLPYLLAQEAWNIRQIITQTPSLPLPNDLHEIYEDDELCSDILAYDPRGIALVLVNALRELHHIEETLQNEQRVIAYQALRLYGPLAGQLGWQSLRRQLFDLGFKYYDSDSHKFWENQFSQLQKETKIAVLEAKKRVYSVLLNEGIEKPDIKTVDRNLYSIMRDPGDSDAPSRLLVVTDQPTRVARALLSLHEIWPSSSPITNYINHPKANGYQSIHTTIIVNDMRIRVHIRTKEMDEVAKRGILSQLGLKGYLYGEKLQRLRMDYLPRLLNHTSGNRVMGNTEPERRIYVRTKDGILRGLPEASTVLQFADMISRHLGDQAIAARVDGREKPLHYQLQNMEEVEVLTESDGSSNINKWQEYKDSLRSTSHQVRVLAIDRPGLLLDLCNEVLLHKINIAEARVDIELPQGLARINLNLLDIPSSTIRKLGDNLIKVQGVWRVRSGPLTVKEATVSPNLPNRQLHIVMNNLGDHSTLLHELWRKASTAKLHILGARVIHRLNADSRIADVILNIVECPNKRLEIFANDLRKLLKVEFIEISIAPIIEVRGRDRDGLLRDVCTHLAAQGLNIAGLQARALKAQIGEEPKAVIIISLAQVPPQVVELYNTLCKVNKVEKVIMTPELLPISYTNS